MTITLTAHRLRFDAVAIDPILLNEHKGSSLRGALYHALRGGASPSAWAGFCYNKAAQSCEVCNLAAGCPVCTLVATLNEGSGRGVDVPRPYTIEPPLEERTEYQPGDHLNFGLTLFANALALFPYVIMAVERGMGPAGIGRRDPRHDYRRGRFRVEAAWAENPISDQGQAVLRAGEQMINVPDIPVTHAQIVAASRGMASAGRITLHFLTPTRITEGGRLLKAPAFRPLFQRLMERIASLTRDFTDQPLDEGLKYELVGRAGEIELVEDRTRWVELRSYSTRMRRATPTSGFIGSATYAGDLRPFLPWLLWGQFTHVGKDAVKGNGWYEVATGSDQRPAFSDQPGTDR